MVSCLGSLRVFGRMVAIIGLSLVFSVFANAQFDTGTISGSVADPTGAVIPDANITITNVGTSLQKKLKTDSAGNFVASAMPFGNYVVTAAASNFGETKSPTLVLNVGASVHVNLTLNVAVTQ